MVKKALCRHDGAQKTTHATESKMKKIGWNDLMQGHQDDLKRIYKVNDRQLEQAVRRHLDGSSPKDRREVYENVYNNKRKS